MSTALGFGKMEPFITGALALDRATVKSEPVNRKLQIVLWGVLLSILLSVAHAGGSLLYPETGLTARDLAVVVNRRDPLSVQIGEAYVARRGVPKGQLVEVSFPPHRRVLPVAEFKALQKAVARQAPEHVQAYLLTWTLPYRVGCMSITTAFALGYSESFCAEGCKLTRQSPYFDSASSAPNRELGMRPAMLLAANDLQQAEQLIARGVAADHSWPAKGKVVLMRTPDRARTVREKRWPVVSSLLRGILPVKDIEAEALRDQSDVLFYFTGLAKVPDIETNDYLPGAVADHLTSAGGILDGNRQMSIMRWLEAGLTGSYGAVVEPCNFLEKFPDVPVFLTHYLAGETLLEAYWKSVRMPGQGLFVGEPLARPFAGFRVVPGESGGYLLRGYGGRLWLLQVAPAPIGPYRTVKQLETRLGLVELPLPPAEHHFRLRVAGTEGSRNHLLRW